MGPDGMRVSGGAASRSKRSIVAALCAGALAAGCTVVQPDEGGEAQWGTKNQSVLPRPSEPIPLEMPEPFEMHGGPRLRAGAVELLWTAMQSDSALLRANALEALRESPEHLGPVLGDALQDENRGVRFVAAVIVGKLQIHDAVPWVSGLAEDQSASVRAAAIFALRRCELPGVDPTPLAGMLLSDDAEVRANVAMILGELGDPSALPMLREAIRRPLTRVPVARARIVELQIAEAMVRLGAEDQLDVIRAAVFTPAEQGEITVLACQIAGRLGDRAYVSALLEKAMRTGEAQEPPEIRLAAVEALARIDARGVSARIDGVMAPIDVAKDYLTHGRADVRAQAVSTLGWSRDPSVLPFIAAMLTEETPVVQVAAAGAILRIRSE